MRCIAREKDVAHLEMLIDAMRNVKTRFPNRRSGSLNTRDFVNGIFLRAYDSPSLRHAINSMRRSIPVARFFESFGQQSFRCCLRQRQKKWIFMAHLAFEQNFSSRFAALRKTNTTHGHAQRQHLFSDASRFENLQCSRIDSYLRVGFETCVYFLNIGVGHAANGHDEQTDTSRWRLCESPVRLTTKMISKQIAT